MATMTPQTSPQEVNLPEPSVAAAKPHGAPELESQHQTHRGLKSRHSQMIALGGTIGTGLFVGSGQALARGGPAFVLGCYAVLAVIVYCVVSAIVEVAAYSPTEGSSVSLFASRYVSRSLGFALGYLYFYSLGILVPYEITAAALVIEYWHPPVHMAVWLTLMVGVIVGVNFFPVKIYGEVEFWFASTKVLMMLGLLVISAVLFFGGGPNHDRLGFRYWKHPGAVNTYLEGGDLGRFLALLSTLVMASFPFSFAPEMMVVTAGEMERPRENLPKAARRYIIRLIVFYIGSVLAIGIICPSTDPALTSGGQGAGASPFVVGIRNAGIRGLDSVINAGILISAWSSANSYLYFSSRSLYGLALAGNGPAIFSRCNRWGVPYHAVAAASAFCALAYLNLASSSAVVFTWLVNLTNTSAFISWISCGIVYLRFRRARIHQGLDEKILPYQSRLQPYGAYTLIGTYSFLLLINGYSIFWPQNWSATAFLTAYIGLPVFLVVYFGHQIYALVKVEGERKKKTAWESTIGSPSPYPIPGESRARALKRVLLMDSTIVDLASGFEEKGREHKPETPASPPKGPVSWVKCLWE